MVTSTLLLLLSSPAACASSALPAGAIAANQAGIALSQSGRHAEAIHKLEESLAIAPEQDDTLVNLGLVWEEIGLPLKALECYGRAIEVAPESAAGYINMGRALEAHLGEREAAVEAVEAALAIDPGRDDGWNVLGQLRHSQGELDNAREALSHAVALRPDDVTLRCNLAKALRDVGLFAESVSEAIVGASLPEKVQSLLHLSASERRAALAADGQMTREGMQVAMVKEEALPRLEEEEEEEGEEGDASVWRARLDRVYLTPMIASVAECEWVIATAEAHAAASGGWEGDGHHDAHPTNDLVVARIPEVRQWVQHKLANDIWPALALQFGVSEEDLWLEDCFVVKYESKGQPGLGPHADDSELSFNLLLSEPSSFVGGGTAFADAVVPALDPSRGLEAGRCQVEREEASGVTVRPRRGEMLSHYGRVTHEGKPTTGGGARYIMAGFVRARPIAAAWRELRARSQAVEEVLES